MQQLIDRLVKLNSDRWQQSSQTASQIERHIDDVVRLQMMLKDRNKQLARLKAEEEHVTRAEDELQVGFHSLSYLLIHLLT